MKIDFRLRRRAVLRPINTTQIQADKLARLYLAAPQVWTDYSDRILAAYARTLSGLISDDAQDVQYQIDEAENSVVRVIANFKSLFDGWLFDFSVWHFGKLNANLKYAANVNLDSVLTPDGDTLAAILARNVSLIRSVSDDTRTKIQDIVFRGMTNRTPVTEIAKEIREATAFSRARARRIASDQTVKAGAALDESRMRDIGINKFEWDHSDKLHFRPWHKARNGKTFSWDDPEIKNDKPGYAPFCGCKARGVIDGSE